MELREATPQSVIKPTRLATVMVLSVKNKNTIPPIKARGIVAIIWSIMVFDLKWLNKTKAIASNDINENQNILRLARCWFSNWPP